MTPEDLRQQSRRKRERADLPPLRADAYLAWLWRSSEGKGRPWTVAEYAMNFGFASFAEARRNLVGLAARARRDARLAALGYAYHRHGAGAAGEGV